MQKYFDSWRSFIQAPAKKQELLKEAAPSWMKKADQRVVNDVLRAAEEAGADNFSKRLLLGFLKIESGGKAKHTFYNPDMAKHRGNVDRPGRVGGARPIGPFQILQRYQDSYKKYGYKPGQFGDPYHQAKVVLNFIKARRARIGDDPARIYLSWNQGIGGANRIYNNLRNNPDSAIGSGGGLAGNMRNNFSGRALKRYGISNKDQITPSIFVDRYSQLLGFGGEIPDATSTTDFASNDPNTRNIIIAGNSHAGGMKAAITTYYDNLGAKTGVNYNLIHIHASQGHGGEVEGQIKRIEAETEKLQGQDVAAIIHVGTNRGHGDIDKLLELYQQISSNVNIVGTPEANQTPNQRTYRGKPIDWTREQYENRVSFNNELKEKANKLEGVNFVDTFGSTSQTDLSDNVHLRKRAYTRLFSDISSQIHFDNISGGGAAQAGAEVTPGVTTSREWDDSAGGTVRTTSGTGSGSFVHGFKREDFKAGEQKFDFDKFYQKLDTQFADQGGAAGMLANFGKDRQFGREHKDAWDALQSSRLQDVPPPAEQPAIASLTIEDPPVTPVVSTPPPLMPAAAAAEEEEKIQSPDVMPASAITEEREKIILPAYMPLTKYNNIFFEQDQRWSSQDLIRVDLALKYEKDFSFYGNVLNQIRSIKGITIAKADEAGVVEISPDKRMVLLHLKFMPDRPISQYIFYLQTELKKLQDKDGDKIMAVEMKSIPEKIKS